MAPGTARFATVLSFIHSRGCSTRSLAGRTTLASLQSLVWELYHSHRETKVRQVSEVFNRLIQYHPPTADAYLFNALLTTVSKSGNYRDVFSLYNRMVLVVLPDAYTACILINSANEMRRPDLGFGAFCGMLKSGYRPNARVLTLLIRGLCQENLVDAAVKLFRKMPELGCVTDVVAYNDLISCCNMISSGLGFIFLCDMIKRGHQADSITLNVMLSGLCKCGRVVDAVRLLRRMSELGCATNTVSYNTIINSLCCHADTVNVGFGIFCELLKKGLPFDLMTLNMLLRGSCYSGWIAEATNMFHRIQKLGFYPDVYTYGTLIDCYFCSGKREVGFGVLCSMLKQGVHLNPPILSSIVNGLCKGSLIAEAATYFRRMFEIGCDPNAITYSCIIDCCCHLERLDLAYGTLCDMLKRGLRCNTVTLTSLLNGVSKSSGIEDAAVLLKKMANMGCLPNLVTYGTVINLCCQLSRADLGFGMLCDMFKKGYHVNIIILNSLVHGLCISNNVPSAAVLIESMPKLGFTPDCITFTAIISGLCKMGGVDIALELLRGMNYFGSSCRSDVRTYNTIIEVISKQGRMEDALQLMDEMTTQGISPNKYTYDCLIRGFSNLGKWDEVAKFFQEMVNDDICAGHPHSYTMTG